MRTQTEERWVDLTYKWLASQPVQEYHFKDQIWSTLSEMYPDKLGQNDKRKTPWDTLRVLLKRDAERFSWIGNGRFIVVKHEETKAVSEPQEVSQNTLVASEERLYGREWLKAITACQENHSVTIVNKILQSSRPMITKIARRYVSHCCPLDDLMQEGYRGVLRAIKTFDSQKHSDALSHILNHVRGYVRKYYEQHFSLIRVTKNTPERKMVYRRSEYREARDCYDRHEKEARLNKIAQDTGLTVEKVKTAGERVTYSYIPIGSQFLHPAEKDSKPDLTEETIPSPDPNPEEIYAICEIRSRVQEIVDKIKTDLSEQERCILQRRFLDDDPLTFAEIGEILGLTRQRIQQIEHRLFEKVKARFLREWTN
jgi:RNA polymerase sigma factor (sigma-70 family)